MDPKETHGRSFLLPIPIAIVIARENGYIRRRALQLERITIDDVIEFFDIVIADRVKEANHQ